MWLSDNNTTDTSLVANNFSVPLHSENTAVSSKKAKRNSRVSHQLNLIDMKNEQQIV